MGAVRPKRPAPIAAGFRIDEMPVRQRIGKLSISVQHGHTCGALEIAAPDGVPEQGVSGKIRAGTGQAEVSAGLSGGVSCRVKSLGQTRPDAEQGQAQAEHKPKGKAQPPALGLGEAFTGHRFPGRFRPTPESAKSGPRWDGHQAPGRFRPAEGEWIPPCPPKSACHPRWRG